jgi:hypothetical protein
MIANSSAFSGVSTRPDSIALLQTPTEVNHHDDNTIE